MMQRVTVLGATGSIGRSTLDVLALHKEQFKVTGLTAGKNINLLYQQCLQFKPEYAAILDPKDAKQLETRLREAGICTEVLCGAKAIAGLAGSDDSDTVIAGIVGAAGLLPTMSAVRAGKRVLLANKEALVMAGGLFMAAVARHQATLLPVDSEHNAIFQCLPSGFLPGHAMPSGLQSIILTASGGPFREAPLESLEQVTPAEAIAHPTWQMGQKISVDSATMMNKGLEVIEAHWLFNMPIKKIRVQIHPQSIIHSMVVFDDASVLAQMGSPDMRIPIANALGWPHRIGSNAKHLDFSQVGALTFEPLSLKRYPCLRLAYQALNAGGSAPCALNAANEVAVAAFCQHRIRFTEIASVIEDTMQKAQSVAFHSIEDVMMHDQTVRHLAEDAIRVQELRTT